MNDGGPAGGQGIVDAWQRETIPSDPDLTVRALFDAAWYLSLYDDVRAAGVDPLQHYLDHGGKEGRRPHPLFDGAWYLSQYPDVAGNAGNPLVHYVYHGAFERRDPHPLFDSDWYLHQNPDVAAARVNPLLHYIRIGAKRRRHPHPFFDADWYLGRLDEAVRVRILDPLLHYVRSGVLDGWQLTTVRDVAHGTVRPRPATGAPNPLATLLTFDADPAIQESLTRYADRLPLTLQKYSAIHYLCLAFDDGQRADCFRHHYRFLARRVSATCFDRLLFAKSILYEHRHDGVHYTVTVQALREVAYETDYEGELVVYLRANGVLIFALCLTVVPGAVVGLDDPDIFLITRLQGFPQRFTEIRQASKAFRDVAPPALLLAVMQGLAEGLGFSHAVAIPGRTHPAHKPEWAQLFEQAYDKYLVEVGAEPMPNGFYLLDIPMRQKPLNQIKPGHRLRTKAKRKIKAEVAAAVREAWGSLAVG